MYQSITSFPYHRAHISCFFFWWLIFSPLSPHQAGVFQHRTQSQRSQGQSPRMTLKLKSSLPPHQAAVSQQRIFLSSWRIVGDRESCHPEQQEQVEEVQWRGCWSTLRAEKISNQEENSTFKSNWKLPGDARAVWPPGPGPPLLLLGIQRWQCCTTSCSVQSGPGDGL